MNHRQHFPALTNKAYFNYGGQGPLSKQALEAIVTSYKQIELRGPFSAEANAWMTKEAEETRCMIGGELGVPASSITLTEDVTVGCNIALWGIDWRPGDHLLLTDCEHQGVIAAVRELQRRYDIEVSTCPLKATLNEGSPLDVIAQYLRSNTRLVVISHILWNTGQVLPLEEIIQLCRSHSTWGQPVRILVDAAQSVGVLPLNLAQLEPDFYAFTGHKWWCGPAGLGGLYVHPAILESVRPTFIGWRSVKVNSQGEPVEFKSDGRRFEIASSSTTLYAGLRTAIALHHEWGTTEKRYQRIRELSKILWEKLNNLAGVSCLKKSPPDAGLVSFQLHETQIESGRTHDDLVNYLEERNIMVRTLLNPDCVRACVHYFTLESEIDQLIEAILDFQAK
ncbi:aminotransferase class V-fold PLP-dependent enzyme [Ancylothrix sp. C2]|uniref:aminotransferase class V-fold PLP-dependent enzyme n=1 Tax=Ancylothrix sp. D3o TaxID=2953691 RepID=UPI0021BB2423|nr:aminotransferase class V-fold PLP-dependent enzyme [Ancylothrix sp. D3o]MCT7948622.1 aminotransferase class V-fold PLP-dependent enzyme [Ancylothrix sp. D3o]